MESKVCTKCGERKTLTELHTTTASKDGRRAQCKACANAYKNRRYAEDAEYREKMRENARSSQGNVLLAVYKSKKKVSR